MEDNDAQLQLKKRARRRLVGAVFFASVVAIVLPMVMDHDPRPPVQDVEIRIPGQDDKPFSPGFVAAPLESPPEKPQARPEADGAQATPAGRDEPVVARVAERGLPTTDSEAAADKTAAKPAKPVDKESAKPVTDKPAEKTEKPEKTKNAAADEAKRAAAILAGQGATAAPAARGEHLILIGAFANEANVTNLKKKLAELGIKTFTEPLNTPQGKKTRLRAGPFANREAADKALDKMRRIGVSGVVAAKQ